MIDDQPFAPDADVAAWCQLLGTVRDQAKDAGEDFLAYLAGVALSHAKTLPRIVPPDVPGAPATGRAGRGDGGWRPTR